MNRFKLYANDLGVDPGTARTLISDANGNILLDEPSITALDLNTYEVLAVGSEAKNMTGKTPENIVVVAPIENGIIADFEIALAMLSRFLQKAVGGYSLFQPKVNVTCPFGLTDVERRSVEDVMLHAGARDAVLVEENIASGLGLDLDITEPRGRLLCNIGAGTLETSAISLSGMITGRTEPLAGEYIDRMIHERIKRKYNVLIGKTSCEELKKELGTVDPDAQEATYEVSGRNLVTGMPEIITVEGKDIAPPVFAVAEAAASSIRKVLETVPPEVARDILEDGILLVGGSSFIRGLPAFIEKRLELPVRVFDDPVTITGRGIGLSTKIEVK